MASRPRLDRSTILAAAFDIVERDGLQGLTMRRLAARLGVAPMAAYRHFADRAALIDAMLEAAGSSLEAATPDTATGWRDGLAGLARGLRDGLVRYPGLIEAVVARPSLDAASIRLADRAYRYLLAADVDPRSIERSVTLLFGYVLGFVAIETPRRSALDNDLFQDQAAVQEAYASIDPADIPSTIRIAPVASRFSDEEQFEFGLAVILDGIAART